MTGFSTVEKAGGDEGVDLWGQSERTYVVNTFLDFSDVCEADVWWIFGMQLKIGIFSNLIS